MLNIGSVIDNRYKILRVIGRGATSCVYLAENIRLHNYWAIKEVYKTSVVGGQGDGKMFIAEANILTRLRHPGLPAIVDILNTPSAYLVVMEYVDGISLDKVLEQRGAQKEEDVVKWGKQLCEVLTYLHSQQPAIIYRDMKPANIMLKKNGDVVLIDFGMAREFKAQRQYDTTNLGTHGYAAPEQYSHTVQTNARTDIYCLGMTLYHLVTGQDPCLPPYGTQTLQNINPALSKNLDQVIRKATQYRMEDRYASAAQMQQALSGGNTQQPLTRIPFEEEEEEEKKSSAGLVLAIVIPLVLLLIIGIVGGVVALQSGGLGGGGSSIQDLFGQEDDTSLYYEQYVYISYADERKFYEFIPEKSGTYYIYSLSDEGAPLAWLLDENDNVIIEDNTYGRYADFSMTCTLYKGETYWIETTLYDLDPSLPATGGYYICIEYVP